jgi:CTP synthase (UTP-ammonia lyase)
MTKFEVVTDKVLSGLGEVILTASIGKMLSCSHDLCAIECDLISDSSSVSF